MKPRRNSLSLVVIMVEAFGSLLYTLVNDNKPALGLDLQGGISVVLTPPKHAKVSAGTLKESIAIIRNRVDALGVGEISSRLEVVVPDRPGTLAQLAAIIGSFRVNITSVLSTRHVEVGKRANFFRIATLNVGPIRKAIEEAGFEILDPSKFLLP